jgi:putative ABC transport system substrate-binding protein
MIRRREFMTLLGSAAAWPLAARAQQPQMPVIGFLSSASPDGFAHLVKAFREGLQGSGFVEGQNIAIEFRWADGQYDRLPALCADLLRLPIAVIVASGGNASALAAKAATKTIPIVFTGVSAPVEAGLVASMSRPAGNITGFSQFNSALNAKRLELLRELLPGVPEIGLLMNPVNPVPDAENVFGAARALGQHLVVAEASSERQIDGGFASLVERKIGAILVASDPFFSSRRAQIVALAAVHSIPAVYPVSEYAIAGGLMSYAASITEGYREAGVYVSRILKGADAGNLPVQQSSKFELVINLRTAKALGIEIPANLLARADEVIE